MRLPSLLVAMLTALPFQTSTATAQSPLATVFNGSATGKTVYFDLDVTAPAITITSLDLKVLGAGSIQIYERAGTRVGHLNSPAGWTLVSSGTVSNSLALAAATTANVSPFALTAGLHGIAVHVIDQSATVGLSQYASGGAGVSMTAARAEVTLQAGELGNQLFGPVAAGSFIANIRIRYLGGDLASIPPHGSVYNLLSRGFNFTAATDFLIRQLELPPEAKQAGDTASYLVRKNGVVAFRSVGNTGAVTANVSVNLGDVVDVIGNWSPAAAGYGTAHNSYAVGSSPFTTTILGVPHTLNRMGWQWDIGDPNWTPNGSTGAALPPSNGQMGRIWMTTGPAFDATNTALGQGCGQQFTSIYELMTPATFDLANSALRFAPTASGGYRVTRGGALLPVSPSAVPVGLAQGLPQFDDTLLPIPFTTGSFPGWASIIVCTNGWVQPPSASNANAYPSVAEMLNFSRTAFRAWHDYNPSSPGSGLIKFTQSPQVTVITWDGVHGYNDPTPSTLQFQLYSNGEVVIAFGSVSTNPGGNEHMIGYSPAGASTDPGPIDFSSLGATFTQPADAPALALTATTRPIAGTSWNLQLDNVPAATVFGVDIGGLSDPGVLDLAFLGMPTCQLRASLDAVIVWAHGGGSTHNYSLPVPPLAALGMSIYLTSATFSAEPVNTFGAVLSNGIRGTIGTF
jgi:hypothetical protein